MTYNVYDQTSLNAAMASADSNIDINVTNSFVMISGVTVPAGKTIAISSQPGEQYTITRSTGLTGSLFIGNSATTVWTLSNIIIDGNKSAISDAGGPLLRNTGRLTLLSGAILQNNASTNVSSSFYGGAVYNRSGGTLSMAGGIIRGNDVVGTSSGYGGGGVFSEGTFNMTGGEITENTVTNAGGGVHSLGSFSMSSGKISFNNAGSGGGISMSTQSTLTMSGGEISDNTAITGGGINNSYGRQIIINDGLITRNTATGSGGGIYDYSGTGMVFTINGGEISYNRATGSGVGQTYDGRGGGIWTATYLFTMTNGKIIYNTANGHGGGVECQGSGPDGIKTVNISGGLISANEARGSGAYDGGGGLYVSRLFMTGGDITNNRAVNGYGGGIYLNPSPQGSSGDVTGTVISGNYARLDGGGIYFRGSEAFTLSGDAQIADNTAGRNGGGICAVTISTIFAGADVIFANNRASAAYEIRPSDIPTHDAHILTHTFTTPFKYGYNNFDICYQSGTRVAVFDIEARKIAVGAQLPEGRFDFGLYDATGNLVATATNDASGNVVFPVMALPDGSYSYTIRETSPSGGGWVTDSTEFPITISVIGGAATITPSNPPVFTDVFTPGAASVELTASKSAVGAELPVGRFQFGVFDSGGDLIATATNGVDGNVIFPEIFFTEAGTAHYTVFELTPSGGGWTTDGRSFPVTVTVVDGGQGQLVADVTYPKGPPEFVNTYAPPKPVDITVCAKKTVCGACLCVGMFTFGIFDQSGFEVARATNDQNDAVIFPMIAFAEAGTYIYTVRELNASGGGWTMDERSFPVTVTVADGGQGQLVANVTYPKGMPEFINRFCIPCPCQPCK